MVLCVKLFSKCYESFFLQKRCSQYFYGTHIQKWVEGADDQLEIGFIMNGLDHRDCPSHSNLAVSNSSASPYRSSSDPIEGLLDWSSSR